ncbi:MAG: TetR/AcrR family transcriptional regulator C-terminal domain-containing protein [Solobacterium sp.]|nr:TetR/AcrR family transcriptional regulator C-terminal domain-containing protein [Solobacterium sp.]
MLKTYTKELFEKTIIDMTKEMSFEKIRVKDICERIGCDRQTFYYHFRDKYDLAAWIFTKEYEGILRSTNGKFPEEHAAITLRHMYQFRSFYRKAFSDQSQNAISKYIYNYYVNLGTNAVKKILNMDTLDLEIVYSIKSHAYACIGHTIEWLNGTEKYTPEEFARLQYLTMPQILKKAYGIKS